MKILALTSIRSDYDLMSQLYSLLHNDRDIDLRLLVSGAHLSHSYGYTLKNIEQDGFNILLKIESLIDADSLSSRLKSASNLLISSIDVVCDFAPDLIIYAGDREDVMIGALLGGFLSIPTIHFFAGDHAADGHIDNPLRHAASKLSTVHFVSTKQHKQRLLAIAEPEFRIHNIGSIALDKFRLHESEPMPDIYKRFNIAKERQKQEHGLIIFHPIEEEIENAAEYIKYMADTLLQRGMFVFISSPNTDYGNKNIVQAIEVLSANPHVYCYKNLPRADFLSIFKQAKLIIGNSSAGILEAASIPISAVNVGKRQSGRQCGANVIFCDTDKKSIEDAVIKACSDNFIKSFADIKNIYGDGNSSKRAYDLIKNIDFLSILKKKEDPLENINEK